MKNSTFSNIYQIFFNFFFIWGKWCILFHCKWLPKTLLQNQAEGIPTGGIFAKFSCQWKWRMFLIVDSFVNGFQFATSPIFFPSKKEGIVFNHVKNKIINYFLALLYFVKDPYLIIWNFLLFIVPFQAKKKHNSDMRGLEKFVLNACLIPKYCRIPKWLFYSREPFLFNVVSNFNKINGLDSNPIFIYF